MIPIVLTIDEARLALAGKLTEIRRPIEGLPPDPQNVRYLGGYLKCDNPPGSETVSRRISCPWGVPWVGPDYEQFIEYLYACEPWGVGCRPHPVHGWVDGIEYQADESSLEGESAILPLYEVEPPPGLSLSDYEGDGWQTAESMGLWASRFAYRNRRVRVEQVAGAWTWIVTLERVNRPSGEPVPPAELEGSST